MNLSPQQKTALFSVIAALMLMGIKLVVGLMTGSLGLIAEALHSGTDTVAALLTLFALGVAIRPADHRHPYGHGKAEHLAALAEAALLVAASIFIIVKSITRLTSGDQSAVDPAWYAIAILVLVLAVDATRAAVSFRASKRYKSPALAASGWHFISDFGGTTAVLVGLILVRAGFPAADSIAALCVAVLVLAAAGRIMRGNINVLMDQLPTEAEILAKRAITEIGPEIELRRLRIREAAGRTFADVIIGVPSTAVVGQGHAAADDVERAIEKVLPDSDVVVHVEPSPPPTRELRERVRAAATAVTGVYEIHNINVLYVGSRIEASLHLKLPRSLTLDQAHAICSRLEQQIDEAVPEIDEIQTHMEPLSDSTMSNSVPKDEVQAEHKLVCGIALDIVGAEPRKIRFIRIDSGLVAFLTLALDPEKSLSSAHDTAGKIKALILSKESVIVDVFVHTEP